MIDFKNFLLEEKEIKDTSYGFIIRSQDKYLICHPTNGITWSLPKGHAEEGESGLDAAYRETKEETGLDLRNIDGEIRYIGEFVYRNKRKKIKIWLFDSREDITGFKLHCNSIITNKDNINYNKQEIDRYEWVTKNKAKRRLHEASAEAIKRL